jgi:hypothetical protein
MSDEFKACTDDPNFQRLLSLRFQHLLLPASCEGLGLLSDTGFGMHKTLLYDDRQHCVFECQEITDLESPSGNAKPKRKLFVRKLYHLLQQELSLEKCLQITTQDAMDSQTTQQLDGIAYFLVFQSTEGMCIQRCYCNPQDSSRQEIRSLSRSLERLSLINSFDLWWLQFRKSLFQQTPHGQ